MPATFAARFSNAGEQAFALFSRATILNFVHHRSIFKASRMDFTRLMLRRILISTIVVLGGSSNAFSQVYGSGNHQVTVIVNPISLLQVTGGAVNFNVTTANVVAGQDQMSLVNNATQLVWGTNSSLQKITAQTSLGTPLYTLNLLAVSPTQGNATSEFTLSTTAADLLINIGRSSGSCILQYTAIALASQGTGTDNHTITFTVQAQ